MSISMKELFSRQGIVGEVISLRNSLSNHHQGLQLSLREAHGRFLQPVDGNGYARGCHSSQIPAFGALADVVPAWVPVDDYETRTIEGILTKSKITNTDFPLKPWHTYYDWNFLILLDRQYTYLLSQSNVQDDKNIFEGEWDTAFLPSWAFPQDNDRIWMVGRWIYDCGHPKEHGHKTEIHPPKAIASFRMEAVTFPGNSGPTQANNAVLYIGQNGGYWQQPINDQDYAFDLYLPPKPYAEAIPQGIVESQTGILPVQPQITPFPANDPKLLRVVIPLKGVTPHPEEYGAIISAGWSDPRNTESARILRKRITVTIIDMDRNIDIFSGDEWDVYIGVNGRWRIWKGIGGDSEALNFSVDLDLHPSDQIHITACGFEEDLVHGYMGDESGYSWAQISNPNLTQNQVRAIIGKITRQLAGSLRDENTPISSFSQYHNPTEQGNFTKPSSRSDYRLRYTIANR